MILYRKFIFALILCTLFSCKNDSENNVQVTTGNNQVIAVNDDIVTNWDNEISIDATANDVYTGKVSIEISDNPASGELIINGVTIIYMPKSKSVTEDSFSYQLIQNGSKSQSAQVNIHLTNKIVSFRVLEGNKLESDNEYTIVFSTLLPVKEKRDFSLYRSVSGELDDSFEPITISILEGEDTSTIHYYPKASVDKQFEKEHKLELVDQESNESVASFSYQYFHVASPEDMFLSIKNIWYNQGASNLMLNQRGLVMSWMNYPVWSIPENPTWSEDPYKNNSWQLYYHSLFWLFAYEYTYDQTQNELYLDVIGNTILDYFAKSPKSAPKSYMSWDDHSVSWRTDVVSYFYTKYFKYRWNDELKKKFFIGLDEHATELRELLDNPLFERNNHGMFHALSLYNLSFAFPLRTDDTDYRQHSLNRIYDLFNKMVDVETGVSLEQSTHYQLVAIDLFLMAKKLITKLSGSVDQTVNLYLTRMVDFSAHLIYPNGQAPAVGDSNYGHTTYVSTLNNYLKDTGISSQYWDYINSQGNQGSSLQQVFKSETAGYAVLRPNHKGQWQQQSVIFTDFGKKKYAHGHHDAMSFTFFSDGQELLIDSGGPYVYLPPGRTYFWSKYGHNSLIINGEGSVLNDAKLVDAKCIDELCYSLGQLNQQGAIHTRLILSLGFIKPNIYIFDFVDSDTNNDYELLYHFPTNSIVNLQSPELSVDYANAKTVTIKSISSANSKLNYYYGHEDGANKQGWVTPKYAKEVPAPVISYSAQAKDFWQLTSFLQQPTNSQAQVSKSYENFMLQLQDKRLMLNLNEPLNPILTVD